MAGNLNFSEFDVIKCKLNVFNDCIMNYDVIFRNYRDCWYLYTLNPFDKIVSGRLDEEPDQTIEILMTELDPSIMDIFTREKCANGREATKVS